MKKSEFTWWMRKIHLWLSFSLGITFLVISVTGGILIYETPYRRWINQGNFPTSVEDPVPIETVVEDVRKNYPDKKIYQVMWDRPWKKVYDVKISEPNDPKWFNNGQTISYNPNTGKKLTAEYKSPTLMTVSREIHTNLMSGYVGYWLVSLSTFAGIIILVTGVYLWWPGIRDFFKALWVHTDMGTYRFNYDLHNLLGMVTLPVVVVMCITGILIAFPTFGTWFYHGLFLTTPSDQVSDFTEVKKYYSSTVPEDKAARQLASFKKLVQRSKEKLPDRAEPYYLAWPHNEEGLARMRWQTWHNPGVLGTTFNTFLDQYSGEMKYVINPYEQGIPVYLKKTWEFSLHAGTFAGHFVRAIYFFSCVIAPVMMVTGFFLWWLRPG